MVHADAGAAIMIQSVAVKAAIRVFFMVCLPSHIHHPFEARLPRPPWS
jgi:hypothetical protein